MEKKFSSRYDVYVKAVGSPGVDVGAVGVVVSGKDELEFSYTIKNMSLHCRELSGLNFIFDELGTKKESSVSCFFNNMGAVNQLRKDWASKYVDFFDPLVNEIKPKEDCFESVRYEFVKGDNEYILRAKGLAEVAFGKCN